MRLIAAQDNGCQGGAAGEMHREKSTTWNLPGCNYYSCHSSRNFDIEYQIPCVLYDCIVTNRLDGHYNQLEIAIYSSREICTRGNAQK